MADYPHWHILGAGSIGGLWACELFRSGRKPLLIFRDEAALAAYRLAGGISLKQAGTTEHFDVAATCPAHLQTPLTQVLITTKAHQTSAAVAAIAHRLAADAVLVLMQNGMGVAEQLREQYPGLTVLLASTTEGAYREGNFAVVHVGGGGTLIGGDFAAAACAQSLSTPQLPVGVSENIERVLWRKLAVNCVINPLTALHHCRNGELLERPQLAADVQRVCDEIAALSAALGREEWIDDLEQEVHRVAHATAANRSSMLQDIEAGRATEIDYINGYLCRLAEEKGLDLPINRELVRRIHKTRADSALHL